MLVGGRVLEERRAARLIANPVRAQLLGMLDGRSASRAELARELDKPVNLVAYHVSILARDGVIELVGTQPARGSTEHFYRALVRIAIEETGPAELVASGPHLRTPVRIVVTQARRRAARPVEVPA